MPPADDIGTLVKKKLGVSQAQAPTTRQTAPIKK